MNEPPKISNISALNAPVQPKVRAVLAAMQKRGYDAVCYETKRTLDRQKWLYGVGRTHDLNRKPVTWTMNSLHLSGNAADVISKSRGWNWPSFYEALKEEAAKVGMHTIPQEQCHIQYG